MESGALLPSRPWRGVSAVQGVNLAQSGGAPIPGAPISSRAVRRQPRATLRPLASSRPVATRPGTPVISPRRHSVTVRPSSLNLLARATGFEPLTFAFGGKRTDPSSGRSQNGRAQVCDGAGRLFGKMHYRQVGAQARCRADVSCVSSATAYLAYRRRAPATWIVPRPPDRRGGSLGGGKRLDNEISELLSYLLSEDRNSYGAFG